MTVAWSDRTHVVPGPFRDLFHRWTILIKTQEATILSSREQGKLSVASMLAACYRLFMASIQVKNIPEGLHNKLRRYAREQEITIGEIVLEAIEREVARREWHKRFTSRPTTRLRSSAAQLLEQERRLRNNDLS